MRISEKALENIRAVIEQQETKWLKDNGFDPVPHRPEPRMFRRKVKEGNFSADRFLGSTPPAESPAPAPEPEQDNTPEAVEIIPQKDGRHSWLYNEVMKAIRDAAGDGRNTKVIAIFVPVVQNGKEFEDLPVSASVELSPVQEEDVRMDVADLSTEPEPEPEPLEEPAPVEPEPEAASEPVDHVGDLLPTEHIEHDPELVEAFNTMEEKLDEQIANSQEEESEPEIMSFTEEVPDESEGEPAGLLPLPDPAELESFDELESEQEDFAEDGDLVQVPELAEIPKDFAFSEDEIIDEPEEESAGEKMTFTEIQLPPSLEDDEVIDDIEIQEEPEDHIKL